MSQTTPTPLKVKLKLIGLDSNVFAVLGAFSVAARRQGCSQDEIKAVIKEATSGDYNHALATIMANCTDISGESEEEPDDEEEEEDEFEEEGR